MNHRYPALNCLVTMALTACLAAGSALAAPVAPPNLPKRPGQLPVEELLAILLNHIAGQRDAIVAIQRELVKRPGITPEDGGGGEEDKARWIEDWLMEEGLPPAERVDCPDDRVPVKVRPNLILRHPAKPQGGSTLWVISYLDNSLHGDEKAWIGSPLSLRVDGDTMYGLGVQDNNDAIAAALLVLRALHHYDLIAPMNFGVLLVSDEKKGSKAGFEYLINQRPHLFGKGDQFLIPSYGVETGNVIEIGEKGVLALKITILGRQSHAAFAHQGKNALTAGADLIVALSRLHENFPERDYLFDPPYATFTPTRPEVVTTSFNQVPGAFAFHLNVRLLPGQRLEKIQDAVDTQMERVGKEYAVEIMSERLLYMPAAPNTAPDAPMVLAVKRAIVEQLGRSPVLVGVGGVSLASALRHMGYSPVVWRMAPFQENTPNESMSIFSNLVEASLIVRLLLDRELADAAAGVGNSAPSDGNTP